MQAKQRCLERPSHRLPSVIPEGVRKAKELGTHPHLLCRGWGWGGGEVHVWYSVSETILTRVVRARAWSLAALINQVQQPILHKPIKLTNNFKRQKRHIYLIWHISARWTERHNALPSSISCPRLSWGLPNIIWVPVFPEPPDELSIYFWETSLPILLGQGLALFLLSAGNV